MSKKSNFDPIAYISDFSKKNYKHYHIVVNLKDTDVIEQIEKQESKNKYIVDLIRADLNKLNG